MFRMLKKLVLVIGIAAMLGTIGYTAMAFRMVAGSDASTVLYFVSSETLPMAPRLIANWRVQSWDSCPVTDRSQSPLSMTLRGYGIESFDNERILATASFLIELGCDANQHNMTGHTALHEAILYNEPDVVRFLLAHGADPAVMIETPDNEPISSRRLFSGMDSIRFTEELQLSSPESENRSEILALLQQPGG